MPNFEKKDGINIYYELLNNHSGTQVCCVLIGGLTRDHTIWRKVVPLLIQKDFKILIFDNRDAGQSSVPAYEYGIAEMANDVVELIQYLVCYPVHIIGHSMGGFIAMYIASKHSELVKKLILCSTSEKQEPAGIAYLNARVALIDEQLAKGERATTSSEQDILAVLDKLYDSENLKNSTFVEQIIQHETENLYPQSAESFKRQVRACINHNASKFIQDIVCPVLVLTGESDRYYTPEVAKNLAKKFKAVTIEIIPKSAHMVQIEQPEKLVSKIHNFIKT